MRDILTFTCENDTLVGTLDRADGPTGLLIVSGGNEIRVGAHRGMARLAAAVAAEGHPVFRFDRRGVGDSEGTNQGFRASAPDIAAALAAFRTACPDIRRVIGFGNCDAATALVLHAPPLDALVLANPWVVEPVDALPPAPAIKDHYARRVRDPEAWAALLTGKVDLRAVAKGVGRLAMPSRAPRPLAHEVAQALSARPLPVTLILARRDGTALTFIDAWNGSDYAALRDRPDVRTVIIDSASHSFAGDGDFDALLATVLDALAPA